MRSASFSLLFISAFAKAECPTLFPMVDIHVCAGGTAILSPFVEGSFTSMEWSKAPGQLEDKGGFVYEYSPDSTETGKQVSLTLTATPPSGCAVQKQSVNLTVDAMPEVNLNDVRLCEGTLIVMDPQKLTVYDSLAWSTTGTGKFIKPHEAITVYDPSAADVKSDGLDLTVNVYHGVCPVAVASSHLIIDEKPALKLDKKWSDDLCEIVVKEKQDLEYRWKTNGQGNLIEHGSRVTYQPLKGETGVWFSVSAINERGCEATAELKLSSDTP